MSNLDSLVTVSPRFMRSVALSRDAQHREALDGYILTPTGRDILGRLADALRNHTPTRAWSITGPYGSGKSAFALLAAQALGGDSSVRSRARAFLAEHDAALHERLFGAGAVLAKKNSRLCPVLVTGSRRPLEKALAAALASAIRDIPKLGRRPGIIDRLERLADASGSSGTTIVRLFEEANNYLDERFGNDEAGILLIVDELGKFLEFGASNPEQGDVFVLQELAESATRSARPFLFLTILHQSVDGYADHMSPGRRAEWPRFRAGSPMWLSRKGPSNYSGCRPTRSATRATRPRSGNFGSRRNGTRQTPPASKPDRCRRRRCRNAWSRPIPFTL